MRKYIASLLLALTWIKSSHAAGPKVDSPPLETFRLENGLSVILRPIQGAKDVALLVLFDIGGDHDPRGRCGLAHLVEHVYVTAAAGEAKMRTANDYMRHYRAGCNAQTGDRYTVIATVFAGDDLNKELRDAAARMGNLSVTAADLEREKPRIDEELTNMFGRIPSLGARNLAHELVRPTPHDGRRGGQPEYIRGATLEEVQQHWKRYYKPCNAILVLAGNLDAKGARRAVTDQFAGVPGGEKPPAAAEPGKPQFGAVKEQTVQSIAPRSHPQACLAYAAPLPSSDLYAPFLILVARLFAHAQKAQSGPEGFPVHFALLDDPSVLSVNFPLQRGESAQQARQRLEAFIKAAVEPKLGENECHSVRETFGLFLGTADLADRLLAQNPYGVAFSLGRRRQLGIDAAKLKKALAAVTDDDRRRAATEIFGPGRYAAAFVSIKEKKNPQSLSGDRKLGEEFFAPKERRRMNDPWFDPNRCGWLLGIVIGSWGAWLGVANTLVHKGKAWPLVLGLGLLLDGFSVVLLAAGLTALVSGQSFGVWFNLVGLGLPGVLAITCTLLIFKKRYRETEERHMRDGHGNEELAVD